MASHGSRRRRSAQEWTLLIQAWNASRLTAKEFAASHGVSAESLGWWRWRLRSASDAARVRLARVEVEPEGIATTDSAAGSWEIVTERGTLRVHEGIDAEPLRMVLRALVRSDKR
jgi:hypothetical protein